MPAPKNQADALRRGLFARLFTEEQRLGLKKMQWDDLRHEIFLHRVVGSITFKQMLALLEKEPLDVDKFLKLANFLRYNSATTATSARAHGGLNQAEQEGDPLFEALKDLPFDLPEDEDGQA
jgi:hypothetical protein